MLYIALLDIKSLKLTRFESKAYRSQFQAINLSSSKEREDRMRNPWLAMIKIYAVKLFEKGSSLSQNESAPQTTIPKCG